MRRSTAAAVGTLTGAALIVGVRLSVTPAAAPVAAPAAVDLSGSGADPTPKPAASSSGSGSKASGSKKKESAAPTSKAAPKSGLQDGTYKGKGATNIYGTIQVSIKVSGGAVTAADATYPVTGNSATINPAAIPKLNKEVLQAQSAKVAAVSGATYTSASYAESLQSALDSAKA
jgi:uncharacterized protein with FMN-binding domain